MLVGLVVVLACATGIGAHAAPSSYGRVALVAEDDAFEADRVVLIGVLFDLQPGWHIYWVNPGDAGRPPEIHWELPAGFRAGDIRWPTPLRLTTGRIVHYGYEGLVLLRLPLQVPADYERGTPVTLAANVKYVVCREVCASAQASVTLSMPSVCSAPAHLALRRELFRRAAERSPRPMPPGWKVQVVESRHQIVLSMQTGSPETRGTFFPLEANQIDNAAAQVVTPTGRDGLRMTLKKSYRLVKPVSVLKGVMVLGPDRAFEIVALVSARR